jgi:uncharacterized protein YjiS (DUF1127 family)
LNLRSDPLNTYHNKTQTIWKESTMAYFTETTTSASGGTRRTAAFFDAVVLKMRQRKMYRQTFNELCTLTSRDLADLGMCRSDFRRLSREAADMVK